MQTMTLRTQFAMTAKGMTEAITIHLSIQARRMRVTQKNAKAAIPTKMRRPENASSTYIWD